MTSSPSAGVGRGEGRSSRAGCAITSFYGRSPRAVGSRTICPVTRDEILKLTHLVSCAG